MLQPAHRPRAGNARGHHLLNACVAHADQRKLRGHKEGVGQNQHGHSDKLQQRQTVHLACEHSILRGFKAPRPPVGCSIRWRSLNPLRASSPRLIHRTLASQTSGTNMPKLAYEGAAVHGLCSSLFPWRQVDSRVLEPSDKWARVVANGAGSSFHQSFRGSGSLEPVGGSGGCVAEKQTILDLARHRRRARGGGARNHGGAYGQGHANRSQQDRQSAARRCCAFRGGDRQDSAHHQS